MSITFTEHKRLLTAYLLPQWRRVLLLGVFLLGTIAVQLVNPQLLRQFIDRATRGGSLDDLLRVAMAFLAVALTGQVVSTLSTYYSEDVGWTATNWLRGDLALHVLRLDLGFHNSRTPGELIERVDGDVTQLATFFSQFVVRVFGNGLLLAGIVAVLYREDWRAGAAFTAFTAVALVAMRRAFDVAVPHWKESRQAGAALLGFLGERLAGTEDIRASGATGYSMRRLYQAMREQMRKQRRAWLYGQVMWGGTTALFAVGHVMTFALGAYLLQAGALTLGGMFLLFSYMELLRHPLEQITRQMQELQRATASVGRIADFFGLRSRIEEGVGVPIPGGPLAVEFDHVSFAYEDGVPVVQDLAFRLEPGTVLGLLGRTGSGKSTIGRLLARLYDPTAGAIRLGDADIRDARVADLRRRVAVVTQEVQLFHASLRDNLTLFDPQISDDRVRAALEDIGLGPWLADLPDGLDTIVASGGQGLSAGEAQVLALGRVLLGDPGLVILDEASSRLDPATERLIERAVQRLLRGRTAIVIAHRLSTVQHVGEIVILDDGRLLEHGPRDALVRDPESRFARLLRTGLEEVLV